uniref:Uncharacterized protein n=1 Tax=Strongyloides stercoralis TaxID=6248 RepID=A0A0K0EB98_STRER
MKQVELNSTIKMYFIKYLAIFAILAVKLTLQDDSASSSLENSNESELSENSQPLINELVTPMQEDTTDSAEDVADAIEEAISIEKAEKQVPTEQPETFQKQTLGNSLNLSDEDGKSVETNEQPESSPKPSLDEFEEPLPTSSNEDSNSFIPTKTTNTLPNPPVVAPTKETLANRIKSKFTSGFQEFKEKMNDTRDKISKNLNGFKSKANEFKDRLSKKTVGSHAGKKAKAMKDKFKNKIKDFGSNLKEKFSGFFKKAKN